MSVMWNLWHGCKKYSEGCKNCYVYRGDAKRGVDSEVVSKTKNFYVPTEKNKKGEYKVKSGTLVYTCFTSDFFLDAAEEWRAEAFSMMKERSDLDFLFITKRITEMWHCVPDDWGDGYDNVKIGCTCENQRRVDERLPVFLNMPIKHRIIICEPILEELDLSNYLCDKIEQVVVGGESGSESRKCDYAWVKKIHDECEAKNIDFWFKQTGRLFIKDGKTFVIPRQYQHSQARKANINLEFKKPI